MMPENWHICVNKGITYLLIYEQRSEAGLYDRYGRLWLASELIWRIGFNN